jgi:diguanylate cyclase (GGDEF)-like protein
MHAWIFPPSLDATTREELLLILDGSPPGGPGEARARLQEVCRRKGLPTCSTLMKLVLQAELSEEEASGLWDSLGAHREALASHLGRDPGWSVAAMDYLQQQKAFFSAPALVEDAFLENVFRAARPNAGTRLASSRWFLDLMKREIRRARRASRGFCLILAELDGLGRVNAAYGRTTGDAALKEVFRTLGARLRDTDVVARAGGTRLALLLPAARRLGAHAAAERVRAAVEERTRQPGRAGERLLLTLSAGVSAYPDDGETAERLFQCASLALEQARAGGGNSTVLHFQEKRRGVRFRVVGRTLECGVLGTEAAEPMRLKVCELGTTGALVESPGPLRVGDELEIRLPEAPPRPDLRLRARVERLIPPSPRSPTEGFRVAMGFLSGDAGALDSFLEGLEGRGIQRGDS